MAVYTSSDGHSVFEVLFELVSEYNFFRLRPVYTKGCNPASFLQISTLLDKHFFNPSPSPKTLYFQYSL